jgi:hypothetical protein
VGHRISTKLLKKQAESTREDRKQGHGRVQEVSTKLVLAPSFLSRSKQNPVITDPGTAVSTLLLEVGVA